MPHIDVTSWGTLWEQENWVDKIVCGLVGSMNILAGKSAYVPERQMGDMVLRARRQNPAKHRDENPVAQDKQVNTMMDKPICLEPDLPEYTSSDLLKHCENATPCGKTHY